MLAFKLLPHLLSWAGVVLVLLRGCNGRRLMVAAAACAGFGGGVAAALVLVQTFPGDFSFGVVRGVVGASFFLLFGVSVAALYRSTGTSQKQSIVEKVVGTPAGSALCAVAAGAVSGALCACRLSGANASSLSFILLAAAAVILAVAAVGAEKIVPRAVTVTPSGLAIAVVSLLIFSSSSMVRLDLFAPLTMKLMKFAHDFVHQFFESMLIPDHIFIHTYLWGYIGLLFGKEVGFWGAIIIWFVPVVIIVLAVNFERLPKVSHIRQGAVRRKIIAAALKQRRLKLVIPVLSALLLGAGAYRSCYPSVEYWDPKPVAVTANAAGQILIPRKGEIDLEDGKLHKFLFKRGPKEARFFVIMGPAGKLIVSLDACAICKPDGYGQAEGTVICYYCKTLIPLETVGMPGGCNPVPVTFAEKPDGVHLDGLTLINTWDQTVQSTGGKGGGK